MLKADIDIQFRHNDIQNKNNLIATLSTTSFSIMAECHYVECRLYILYAECRHAECRYAECRGARFDSLP